MSQKHRRYTLKAKESNKILSQVAKKLKINLEDTVGSVANIETVETEFGQLLLIYGKPMLFKVGETVLPTLLAAEILAKLPKIVVDMGAVRFVCNGADVMAPGIRRYEGNFTKGDIAVILDEKYAKPLALGEVLYDSKEAATVKQGPIAKTKHYVSDKIWISAKPLTE